MSAKKRIGEYLLKDGVINHEQLHIALMIHEVTGERLGDIVVQQNFCSREAVVKSMNKHCPDDLIGSSVSTESLPKKFLLETETMDKGTNEPYFYIATLHDDPLWVKERAHEILSKKYPGKEIIVKLTEADITEIRTELDKYRSELNKLKAATVEDEDDVNKVIESLVSEAVENRSSDIHIIDTENTTKIVFRIDGIFRTMHIFEKNQTNTLIARLKILMGADATNSRIQQDGNFPITHNGKMIDLRVACSPCRNGEIVVIRILNRENVKSLDELNISKRNEIEEVARRSKGVTLVCGPTGSGKTTTLYSILKDIMDCIHLNVRTIEDPIEYSIPNIVQTQVNRLVGLDFKEFSRGILRQDPDVILIGELRDTETVENCIVMADTGHAVFSSIHSDSIPTTLTRLEKLGVDLDQLGFVLNGILVQNLVRKICPKCGKRKNNEPKLAVVSDKPVCELCKNEGYYDRVPIIEFVKFDSYHEYQKLREDIANNIITYFTFEDDAKIKVAQGLTDCAEISKRLKKKVHFCQGDKCINGGEKCSL